MKRDRERERGEGGREREVRRRREDGDSRDDEMSAVAAGCPEKNTPAAAEWPGRSVIGARRCPAGAALFVDPQAPDPAQVRLNKRRGTPPYIGSYCHGPPPLRTPAGGEQVWIYLLNPAGRTTKNVI